MNRKGHNTSYLKVITVYIILCIVLFGFSVKAQNQVSFVITSIPSYTPKSDSLYFESSLFNWNPLARKTFRYYPDGCYRLLLDIGNAKAFEYKINRGTWDKVEGDIWGNFLENRKFVYDDSTYEVKFKIHSWQDLFRVSYIQVKVKSVPAYTPHDATIYVSGNFNKWIPDDSTHILTKQADGTYIGKLPVIREKLYYKFTRGSWVSAEGRFDGGMRSNRSIAANDNTESIVTEIDSWNDFPSGMSWIRAIFLALFLQSLIFLGILMRYSKIKVLIFLTGVLAFALFAKFFYGDFKFFDLFPYGFFIPAICYSSIGLFMYSWFHFYLSAETPRLTYVHFLPFLPAIWFISFLFIPSHEFYLKIVNNEIDLFFFGSYTYAFALNLFFSYKLKQLINRQIAQVSELTYQLFKAFRINMNISVSLFVVSGICIWQKIDVKFIIDWIDNLLWLGIGIVLIIFEWSFFKYFINELQKNKAKQQEEANTNRWTTFKAKLTDQMEHKNIYTNPRLTLSDVAKIIGTNNQYTSKIINEEFKKSFTDYINSYRIEAFIRSVKADKTNGNFLYHAFKVGFNSKSAFNRAFKSHTNSTPSEYFTKTK